MCSIVLSTYPCLIGYGEDKVTLADKRKLSQNCESCQIIAIAFDCSDIVIRKLLTFYSFLGVKYY